MVQKYGAFNVLVWLRNAHPCLQTLFERPTEDSNVYGDLRRYHLFVNSCIRAVKYWFRLLHMKENKLSKQALTVVRDFVYIYASLNPAYLQRTILTLLE